jgi:hypothetical protein
MLVMGATVVATTTGRPSIAEGIGHGSDAMSFVDTSPSDPQDAVIANTAVTARAERIREAMPRTL